MMFNDIFCSNTVLKLWRIVNAEAKVSTKGCVFPREQTKIPLALLTTEVNRFYPPCLVLE